MTAFLFAVVAAVSFLTGASAALAKSTFFDTHMAPKPPCYAVAYDSAAMRATPRRSITNFFVWKAEPDPRRAENPHVFEAEFGFRVKKGQVLYTGRAVCRDQGGPVRCGIEGDRGSFTMEPNPAYRAGLRISIDRMSLEGQRGSSGDIAKIADNRLLLVNPAPSTACSSRF